MKHKEKHQKPHIIGAFLAVLAIMCITVGVLVTPQAKAQDGNRLNPDDYITKLQITDKDGNPITGDIDASDSANVVNREIGLEIKGEFPDDARKGDYIEFESSIPVGLVQRSMLLKNTDPDSPYSLAKLDVEDRQTPDGIRQIFRITLLEHADYYSNREFSVKIAINSFNVPCGEQDVLTRPIKFYVRDSDTGNDWFLDTDIRVSGRKCSSNTDPRPRARGWLPGDPIAEARCDVPGNVYVDLGIQGEKTLPNGDKILNYIEPLQNVVMYVGAGQYDTMGDLDFWYDANSKYDPELDNKQYFYKTKEQVQNEIRAGEAFDISVIPVRFNEFEPAPDGLEPGVSDDLFVQAGVSYLRDLSGSVAVVPNNFLFPSNDIATQFKTFVVQNYGDAVWDNTNGEFAKLGNESARDISGKALDLWRGFLSSNMDVVEFLPNEGRVKMTLRNASGVVNLVTADEDKPLRGENARVFEGLTGLMFGFDSELFGTYALYNGSNSYPAPHFKYISSSEKHSGECTGSVERKIGGLDGVAFGERIPAATGSVRWTKRFVNVDGDEENVGSDKVFENIKWELRSVDRPHTVPLGVQDITEYNRFFPKAYAYNDVDKRTGEYLVEGLVPGEYELVEVDVPEGVKLLDNPVRFTVPRGDTTPVDLGIIRNELIPIPYSWEKVNSGGEYISGTRWKVMNLADFWAREEGEQRSWEVEDCVDESCARSDQSRQFTDIDPRPGHIKILAPPYQQYDIEEIFAPEPYVPAAGFGIDAYAEGKEYVHGSPVVNYPEHQVCFVKVDAKTGKPIKSGGAVFEYSWGTAERSDIGGDGVFESDENGSLGCFEYPSKDDDLNFNFTEARSPEGYEEMKTGFQISYSGYSKTFRPTMYLGDRVIPLKVDKVTGDLGQDIHTVYIPNDPVEPFDVPFTLPATGDKPVLIVSLLGGATALLAALRFGQKFASRSRRES